MARKKQPGGGGYDLVAGHDGRVMRFECVRPINIVGNPDRKKIWSNFYINKSLALSLVSRIIHSTQLARDDSDNN